jgi:predicted nucleic-acid-binding protein
LTAFIDTNTLVRYLTGEPVVQARKATALLQDREQLFLTDVVCAELVFVLESVYKLPRPSIAVLVRSLLSLPTISAPSRDLLMKAIEFYEEERLHFAEAHLAASAESAGVRRIASFDQALDRLTVVDRIEEP